jgi:hypothetical protein
MIGGYRCWSRDWSTEWEFYMAKSEMVSAPTDHGEAKFWSEPISRFPRSLPLQMRDYVILYCEILGFAKENRDGVEYQL